MVRLKGRKDENFSCWSFKNFGISEACLVFSKLLVLNFLAILIVSNFHPLMIKFIKYC